jgi:hypothetical protein
MKYTIILLALFATTASAQWHRPGLAYNETGGYVAFMAPYGVTKYSTIWPGSEYRLLYQLPQSVMTVRGASTDSDWYGSYQYSCDGNIWLEGAPMVGTGVSWETNNYTFESVVTCGDPTTQFHLRTDSTAKVHTVFGDATGPGDGVKPLAGHIQADEYGATTIPTGLNFRFRSQAHDWNGWTYFYQAKAPGGKWVKLTSDGYRGSYRPQVLGVHKLRIKAKSVLKSCINKNGKPRRCVKNGPVFRLKAE